MTEINKCLKKYTSLIIFSTFGLLVRNYKPRLMKIKEIITIKSVKNKVLKAKNKFTQKAIKKHNEVWRT